MLPSFRILITRGSLHSQNIVPMAPGRVHLLDRAASPVQLTFLILSPFHCSSHGQDAILSIFPFHPQSLYGGPHAAICPGGKAHHGSHQDYSLTLHMQPHPILVPGGQWLLLGAALAPSLPTPAEGLLKPQVHCYPTVPVLPIATALNPWPLVISMSCISQD